MRGYLVVFKYGAVDFIVSANSKREALKKGRKLLEKHYGVKALGKALEVGKDVYLHKWEVI